MHTNYLSSKNAKNCQNGSIAEVVPAAERDLSAQEAVDFNYLFHFCRNGSIINLKHSLLEGGSSYGRFYFGRICRNC